MNFLNNSDEFIFNTNEKGDLTLGIIDKPKHELVPQVQKDLPSLLLDRSSRNNFDIRKPWFITIDEYYSNCKRNGQLVDDPFADNLFFNLSLLEKSFRVEDICSVDIPRLSNPVGLAVTDLFPFPSGYSKFYGDFSDQHFMDGIQRFWEVTYRGTNYNPLILYSYCSYMHYGYFYAEFLASGFEIEPSSDLLMLEYERLFFGMQKIRTMLPEDFSS